MSHFFSGGGFTKLLLRTKPFNFPIVLTSVTLKLES